MSKSSKNNLALVTLHDLDLVPAINIHFKMKALENANKIIRVNTTRIPKFMDIRSLYNNHNSLIRRILATLRNNEESLRVSVKIL